MRALHFGDDAADEAPIYLAQRDGMGSSLRSLLGA